MSTAAPMACQVSAQDVLLVGRVNPPASTQRFMAALRRERARMQYPNLEFAVALAGDRDVNVITMNQNYPATGG